MSKSDEVSEMLSNLEAIKDGRDPRQSQTESESTEVQTPSTTTESPTTPTGDDRLSVAEQEVDRLFDKHSLNQHIDRDRVHVGVAGWQRKNGVCKYNTKLRGTRRFGKRMSSQPRAAGHHTIVINKRIEDHDDFIDTVRHELAHVVAYAINGSSQKHNHNWKAIASKFGADTKSCHKKSKGYDSKEERFNYLLSCPGCGKTYGKMRRSKTIKQPFNRACGRCGEGPLVSYDAGDKMPEDRGTVAVESIPWDNKEEWFEKGCP